MNSITPATGKILALACGGSLVLCVAILLLHPATPAPLMVCGALVLLSAAALVLYYRGAILSRVRTARYPAPRSPQTGGRIGMGTAGVPPAPAVAAAEGPAAQAVVSGTVPEAPVSDTARPGGGSGEEPYLIPVLQPAEAAERPAENGGARGVPAASPWDAIVLGAAGQDAAGGVSGNSPETVPVPSPGPTSSPPAVTEPPRRGMKDRLSAWQKQVADRKNRRRLAIVLAVIAVIAVIVIWAALAPAGHAAAKNGTVQKNATTPVTTLRTPAPAAAAVRITSTPAPAQTPAPQPTSYVLIEANPTPVPPKHDDLRGNLITTMPVDDYVTIYSLTNANVTQDMPYVSFNVRNPPLVLDYEVKTFNVTVKKDIDYKIINTTYHETLTLHRPFGISSFSVVVRDRATGQVVARDGVGNTDSITTKKRLVLYDTGYYRFEFSGDFATVSLTMKVKRDGNLN